MFKIIAILVLLAAGQPVGQPESFNYMPDGANIATFDSKEACEAVRTGEQSEKDLQSLRDAVTAAKVAEDFTVTSECVAVEPAPKE